MSSKIILDNIMIEKNPTNFTDRIGIQVTFSCIEPIAQPLQWSIIYVGSALSEDYDQVLEQFEISPIEEPSTMQFNVDCDPPDVQKIPRNQLICVTALLITASYKNQQFIRIGYYVHHQLVQEIQNIALVRVEDLVAKIKRTIISDKPRVTKFNISWEDDSLSKAPTKKNNFPEESQSRLQDYFPFLIKKDQPSEEIAGDKKSMEKERTASESDEELMIDQ